MAKTQTQNKTTPSNGTVADYLQSIDDPQRVADCRAVMKLMAAATGKRAKLWGTSIIGFGEYHYTYDSGREGDFLATGFAPGKAKLSVHIMPGYQDYSAILKDLGKHKLGKSCLYINKLDDVDVDVLGRLIRQGLVDLAK